MNKTSNTKEPQCEDTFKCFNENATDYYETLGVDRKATPEDISCAYKRLSLRAHPDQYKKTEQGTETETNFNHVSEAFQVLSDPEKRVRLLAQV